jgi:hypothetical protein
VRFGVERVERVERSGSKTCASWSPRRDGRTDLAPVPQTGIHSAFKRAMDPANPAVGSRLRAPGADAAVVNGGQDRYRMQGRVSRLPGLTVGVVTHLI